MHSSTSPPVGEFTGTAVVVRGGEAIDALHEWCSGGFGELLQSRDAAGAADDSLRLSTLEAYFLAFQQRRLTLRLALPAPPHPASDAASSSDAAADVGSARGTAEPLSDAARCWAIFCAAGAAFPHRYAVYRALRAAGWNVRTGVKYGTDFTLYVRDGPPMSHALLTALVASATEPAERSWCWLQQHVRLCHGVAKVAAAPTRPALRHALRSRTHLLSAQIVA